MQPPQQFPPQQFPPQQFPPQQVGGPNMVGGMPSPGYGIQQGMVFVTAQNNGSATAGMVLGIVSMVLSVLSPLTYFTCCFVSLPLAFFGMICSHIGYSNSKTTGVGNGQAIAGLVLNWLQLLMVFIPIMVFMGVGFFSTV
jgi:hypothetical protein